VTLRLFFPCSEPLFLGIHSFTARKANFFLPSFCRWFFTSKGSSFLHAPFPEIGWFLFFVRLAFVPSCRPLFPPYGTSFPFSSLTTFCGCSRCPPLRRARTRSCFFFFITAGRAVKPPFPSDPLWFEMFRHLFWFLKLRPPSNRGIPPPWNSDALFFLFQGRLTHTCS